MRMKLNVPPSLRLPRLSVLKGVLTEQEIACICDEKGKLVAASKKAAHHARKTYQQVREAAHLISVLERADGIKELLEIAKQLLDVAAHQSHALALEALQDIKTRAPPSSATISEITHLASLASQVPPEALEAEPELADLVLRHDALLSWLRTFSSDHDFRAAVEMALGKSQTECPFELWVNDRVDEKTLSLLSDVRRLLHPYIHRPIHRAATLKEALAPLARIGNMPPSLSERLEKLSSLAQPLADLIDPVGDPSVSQLMQLLLPARQARWRMHSHAAEAKRLQITFLLPDAQGEVHVRSRLLAELEEFHAAILLHAGQRSAQQAAATEKFVDMFAWAKILSATLEELCRTGHPNYLAYTFECALVVEPINMQQEVRRAQKELEEWRVALRALGEQNIIFNAFSGAQLQELLCALDMSTKEAQMAGREGVESAARLILSTWNADLATQAQRTAALTTELVRGWKATDTSRDEAARRAFALLPSGNLPSLDLPPHRQAAVRIVEGDGRLELCPAERSTGLATMRRLAEVLQDALQRTQCRPRLRVLPQEALPPVPLMTPFTPRVHNVCLVSFEAAAALAVVAFAAHGRMPEPRTCLALWSGSTEADVKRFIARWAQSDSFHPADAKDDLHCLIALGADYRLLAAAATSISRWQLGAKAPLLILTGPEKEDYLASQLAYARTTVQPISLADAQTCLKAMLDVWTAGVQTVASNIAGAGKSFAIRRRARRTNSAYMYVPVSAASSLVENTARQFVAARSKAGGPPSAPLSAVLHLDIDTLPQQSGELDRMLFALCLLGQLPMGAKSLSTDPGHGSAGTTAGATAGLCCWLEQHEELAIEMACGALANDVGMLHLLPRCHIVPNAKTFAGTAAGLTQGAIAGREQEAHVMAQKLQEVVAVLERGDAVDFRSLPVEAWPVRRGDDTEPIPSGRCFQLLVSCCPEAATPLSMWALWNLVHVLHWQFGELFSPASVVMRENDARQRGQLALALFYFSLSTAKSLAMRQDVTPGAMHGDPLQVLCSIAFDVSVW
jgi:hypothetical protein